MLFGDWMRAPRRLRLVFVSVMLLLTAALGGLGWRLIEQEREIAHHNMAERPQPAADLLSGADRTLRILKSVDWRGVSGLFFSPDVKYLTYDLPRTEGRPERDVHLISVDGSSEIDTVAHAANDVAMGWSPDGKWLVFATDRGGSTDIWGLPIVNGKPSGRAELLRSNIAVAPA
jgi:dipeptidyl aminopeptidase/acylaminoacyl peptidase